MANTSNPFFNFEFLEFTHDRYYVILSTHDRFKSNDDLNSTAGHAWVIWAHENPQSLASEVSGYGFWPDYAEIQIGTGVSKEHSKFIAGLTVIPSTIIQLFGYSIPGQLVQGILNTNDKIVVGVPGALKKDIFNTPYSASINQIVIEVDKQTYYQSINVIDEYKNSEPDYALLENDCVTFFIEVGEALGLDMPKRDILSPSSYTPSSYMKKLMKQLTSPNKVTLHLRNNNMMLKNYGSASADFDGSYNVVFGLENENKCVLDMGKNRIEMKLRENKLKCSTINYWDGSSWYQEYEAAPIHPHFENVKGLPKPKPISEYWFKNGNYIPGYGHNAIGIDINNVYMILSERNTQYMGGINAKGEPNGIGTISHFGNINNVVRTGRFVNGKFIEHTGVRYGNSVVYGDLQNGEFVGEVRIEYDDNKVFTGTFVNGVAEGFGTYIDNKTGEYYSGNYKNGNLDGMGTMKNRDGIYKGNFTKGIACGNAISYQNNGTVCQGNFVNGRLKSGKFTLPNGKYYVGDFDDLGNPTSGKYFDKNGREITEKENRGGNHDFVSKSNSGNSSGEFCTGHQGYNDTTCTKGGLKND